MLFRSDFDEREQVAEYVGKIPPDVAAEIAYKWANYYDSLIVVDITGGMGVSTVLKLLEFDYKRLHYDSQNGKILSARQRELSNFNKENIRFNVEGDHYEYFSSFFISIPCIFKNSSQ